MIDRRALLLITLLLPTPRWGAARADEVSLKNRVVAEYPTALARMESFFANAKGSGKHTVNMGIGTLDRTTWLFAFRFARDDGMRLYQREWAGERPLPGKFAEEIFCINKNYVFELARMPGANLTVRYYGGKENKPISRTITNNFERYFEAPYSIFGLLVSNILKDPSFKTNNITEISENNHDYIKIEYDYSPKDLILRSGWIVVSPDDGWALQSYESQTSLKGVLVSGKVTYGEKQRGMPIPKSVLFMTGQKSSDLLEFDEIHPGPVDEGEFKLTAFGLPEIGQPGRRSYASHTGYWFLGLALTTLFIALALKYGASRLERQ